MGTSIFVASKEGHFDTVKEMTGANPQVLKERDREGVSVWMDAWMDGACPFLRKVS